MDRGAHEQRSGQPSRRLQIFLSYRRQDTAGHAGWLYESLTTHFSREQVFKDIDNLHAGEDFVAKLQAALEVSDVLLVMLGERWLTITDSEGRRRLDDPNDFVRAEIAAAIERAIPVIPVLVQGARMPRPEELPRRLRRFSRFQAHELTDERWPFDVKRLVDVVRDLKKEPFVGGARETAAILVSDVVGSTRLGEQLAPEDLKRIMGRFVDEMAGAVERHKGEIGASIGDGVVAVFRAPDLAPEERPAREARRAVKAALRISAVLQTLNAELSASGDIDVALRTAVHTGELVVTGETGSPWLMGDAGNVAARLASRSRPGEILLSDAAYRLVAGDVSVERADDVVVRGITEPVSTWRVTAGGQDVGG